MEEESLAHFLPAGLQEPEEAEHENAYKHVNPQAQPFVRRPLGSARAASALKATASKGASAAELNNYKHAKQISLSIFFHLFQLHLSLTFKCTFPAPPLVPAGASSAATSKRSAAANARRLHALEKWQEMPLRPRCTRLQCIACICREELRPVPFKTSKHKTQVCTSFSNHGICPYGVRCRFVHYHSLLFRSEHGAVNPQATLPEINNSSPRDRVDDLACKDSPASPNVLARMRTSRRLPVFESICNENPIGNDSYRSSMSTCSSCEPRSGRSSMSSASSSEDISFALSWNQ